MNLITRRLPIFALFALSASAYDTSRSTWSFDTLTVPGSGDLITVDLHSARVLPRWLLVIEVAPGAVTSVQAGTASRPGAYLKPGIPQMYREFNNVSSRELVLGADFIQVTTHQGENSALLVRLLVAPEKKVAIRYNGDLIVNAPASNGLVLDSGKIVDARVAGMHHLISYLQSSSQGSGAYPGGIAVGGGNTSAITQLPLSQLRELLLTYVDLGQDLSAKATDGYFCTVMLTIGPDGSVSGSSGLPDGYSAVSDGFLKWRFKATGFQHLAKLPIFVTPGKRFITPLTPGIK